MIRVETAVGYVFEVESTDVEVGEQIEVPIPTVENPTEDSEVNDKVLKILSFIRSTLTSDWLYILEWSDEIYANNDILSILEFPTRSLSIIIDLSPSI